MYNVILFPLPPPSPPSPPPPKKKKKTKTNNYAQTAVLEVMHGWDAYSVSANNLFPFEDTITAMFNSLWTTLKKFGINLPIRPYVRQSLNYIFPSTIIPEIKCMQFYLAFEQREHLISSAGVNPLFSVGLVVTHFHVLAYFEIVAWHYC